MMPLHTGRASSFFNTTTPRCMRGGHHTMVVTRCSSSTTSPPVCLQDLLATIDSTQRGLSNKPSTKTAVDAAVAELKRIGAASPITDDSLSATWELLWTTEKETLFILQNASWFGTQAGDVFQVINTTTNTLQNVITFPPEGAFVVDSSIQRQGPLRVEFEFTSARLLLPEQRTWKLPPFGKGWFDNVYVDAQYRVAQDSRGDTLVVVRQGEPRVF